MTGAGVEGVSDGFTQITDFDLIQSTLPPLFMQVDNGQKFYRGRSMEHELQRQQ
jgi:hypothetical protein